MPNVSVLCCSSPAFFFGKKRLKVVERFGFLCRFALLYTWLSFHVQETTVTGRRSNKRKLLGRASRRRQTDRRTPARRWVLQGRLLFHGFILRSEGLCSQAGWEREWREKRGLGMTQLDNSWCQVSLVMLPLPSHPASWDHLELNLPPRGAFGQSHLGNINITPSKISSFSVAQNHAQSRRLRYRVHAQSSWLCCSPAARGVFWEPTEDRGCGERSSCG